MGKSLFSMKKRSSQCITDCYFLFCSLIEVPFIISLLLCSSCTSNKPQHRLTGFSMSCMCRPHGEIGSRLPYVLGLPWSPPTPILPVSVGCPRCVSPWPCSCSAAVQRYEPNFSVFHTVTQTEMRL